MVAKITVPNCIRKALNYNEQKVKEGQAEYLYAHQFLKAAKDMNFYEKLERFELLIEKNKRATTNCVHISLNFGLQENIYKEKLIDIASTYMDKIGFGEQPYLVYKHIDAGHPHIHIVSTNIKKDGKRISLHNIGRNQSNTARKEIETEYNLQRAEQQKPSHSMVIKQVDARKLAYGKSPTKRSISNVLDAVLTHYKYGSLAELNAVLKLYNVTADRGNEYGIIYRNRGLVYRALDAKGNKIGVPIKASTIYNKPTLDFLEKRFGENAIQKLNYQRTLKTSIDWILTKPPRGLEAFEQALGKVNIALVLRQNEEGVIYGLTYIDHNTKCVFNGSDIGKGYSAKAILKKCGAVQNLDGNQLTVKQHSDINLSVNSPVDFSKQEAYQSLDLLKGIITPSDELLYVPKEFKKQRKKKRKRN